LGRKTPFHRRREKKAPDGRQLGHVYDEGGLDLIECGRGGPSVTGCRCQEPGSYRRVRDEKNGKERGRTCFGGGPA
jgi:hypothetical protein